MSFPPIEPVNKCYHTTNHMSFPPTEPVGGCCHTNNIEDSDDGHIAEMKDNMLIYTGNYERCLFISVAPVASIDYIIFHESANEYLHNFYLANDTYNIMKSNNNIILDLGGEGGGSLEDGGIAWYIELEHSSYTTYMKKHARAYIHNGFFYIDDTGEYGPYSIPIQMIDNLINGIYTCPRLKITWNDETNTNEIEEEDDTTS